MNLPIEISEATPSEIYEAMEDLLSGTEAGGWTQAEAVAICVRVEEICPQFGCHVALTGGCLYKIGPRKDLDLVFYRIRQRPEIDIDGLIAALNEVIGIQVIRKHGWLFKATASRHHGKMVDLFFPETLAGDGYEQANP